MGICIIGHFGGKENFTDGQTVKTCALFDIMTKNFPGEIHRADTYYIRRNPLRFLWQMACCVIRDRKIIVLLSENGRRVLFPVLAFLQKYLGKEIYHDAIGGRLADEVAENQKFFRCVSCFSANWVESSALASRLQSLGISNAVYLSNFKNISPVCPEVLPKATGDPMRLCTFSRVMADKGISDAIRAVSRVNLEAGRRAAVLDVYGPVEEAYRDELAQELAQAGDCCRYLGVVPPNGSVDVLAQYDLLLFPTRFRREGMPGTVIDAMFAGLPVIARRWQSCDEMIEDRYNGLVYDFDCPGELKNRIQYALAHAGEVCAMRINCLQAARRYSAEAALEKISTEMGISHG